MRENILFSLDISKITKGIFADKNRIALEKGRGTRTSSIWGEERRGGEGVHGKRNPRR